MVSCSLFGQNLVPNPSFETYSSLPTGAGQWSKAVGWSNVNGWIPFQWPYASPDYCHASGSGIIKLPNTVFGTVNAYDGNAIMGLIIYYPSTSNFREYIATTLTSPMVVGNTYTVSFYITNGIAGSYGGMGISNLGVCLSSGALTQVDHEPIVSATPQYTAGTPFYSSSWQLITFNIVATQAYDHITVGNFDTDANTQAQTFVSTSSPGAYYFVDAFTVEPATPLPIEMLDFTATAYNNSQVDLDWSTATETNNDFFTIEKTVDGVHWETVKQVDGAGTTTEQTNYFDVDRDPYNGISYYRIKQTDYDGNFDYSVVRAVTIGSEEPTEILLYPNPARDEINLVGADSELEEVRIYSEVGQDITDVVLIHREPGRVNIDLKVLSQGIYLVRTRTQTLRFTKQF